MTEKTRPCEICGKMIPAERLEFVPQTRLCVEHSRMIEKLGGEFIYKLTQASLGKEGSLKKNRGDVSVASKKRNTEALARLRRLYEEEKGE